jgi:hypothetical protein
VRFRDPDLMRLKTDPYLDPLRSAPRFQAIERALVRRYGVGIAANDAVNVRSAGLGGEVLHFFVQQEPSAAHDIPRRSITPRG